MRADLMLPTPSMQASCSCLHQALALCAEAAAEGVLQCCGQDVPAEAVRAAPAEGGGSQQRGAADGRLVRHEGEQAHSQLLR